MSDQQAAILVVDDDAAMTSAVCELLRQTGYLAFSAQSGAEALEIVGRHEVHLLLLDMHMPRLTGLEMIERLRDMPGLRYRDQVSSTAREMILPLPWILISAALDEQLIARAQAAAAFSVLPKPVRLPELTGAVTGALAQAYGWRAA